MERDEPGDDTSLDSNDEGLLTETKVVKKNRITEKFIFCIAVLSVILLTHIAAYARWLLPYYFGVSAPVLILIRIIMYWKLKWQYFLLDFCYFSNLMIYTFIWIPHVDNLFAVVFALANGPMIWAIVAYNNSMVFHCIDRLTSGYIHFIPALVSFGARWYPEETLRFWFTDLAPQMPESSVVYLFVVPSACFLLHSIFYALIVQVIAKPKEGYESSYSYFGKSEEGILFKILNLGGVRFRPLMYIIINLAFCLVTLAGVFLWYNFFIAHCILLGITAAVYLWNGATYYMDDFAVRGFIEGECY